MTTRWAFFVDESGNFDDLDDVVVVSGVLLEDRLSLQPHALRAALKRAIPLLVWPPHAWLLNQPAFIAVALREGSKDHPAGVLGAVSSAANEAWRAMRQTDPAAAEALVRAVRSGEPDDAKAEIKSLSAALRAADAVAFDVLRHHGIESRALVARLITKVAHQKPTEITPPVWLVLSAETVVGDAVPSAPSGDRYLELLQVLLSRLAGILRRAGQQHEVAVWVSRRNVANGLVGNERLTVPRLRLLVDAATKEQPSVRLIAAGIGTSTDERGAGYVIADFAANASRIAVFPRGRALEEVYSILRQRVGSVQVQTRAVFSHCAASGDAAALVSLAETAGVDSPRRQLQATPQRAYWACQQAWAWAEAVSK